MGYEDLGYPCKFLIEYRSKGSSDSWIQRRTTNPDQTQLDVSFLSSSAMEVRVAAETCIGRSDFSDVVDTLSTLDSDEDPESVLPSADDKKKKVLLQPPTDVQVISVTGTTAELEWRLPHEDKCYLSYRIMYWIKGEDESSANFKETVFDVSYCWLEDLEPETTYQFHIITFNDSNSESQPGETVEFTTTKHVKLTDTLVQRSKKTGVENGLELYALPLTNVTGRPTTAEYFLFDACKDIGPPLFGADHDVTILFVGASGSGKTLLINAMVNFIFGVTLDDLFRFQLIDPSEADGQRKVTVYDIQRCDEFRFEDSLTIIDTPCYVENDQVKNQEITETIRKFFEDEDRNQAVNLVGFVIDSSVPVLTPLQLYIYCSLISIFGNDVIKNIHFLLTSADKEDPSLWNAVVDAGLVTYGPFQCDQNHHKLNSSIYFCSNSEVDSSECFWEWWENFETFFSTLSSASGRKCVSLSKQLIEEKRRLVTVVNELEVHMSVRIGQLRDLKSICSNIRSLPRPANNFNKNIEFKLDTVGEYKLSLPFGKYVTNCQTCKVTCHSICGVKGGKVGCDVMDHSVPEDSRCCHVCPGKCSWKVHTNQPFYWIYSRQFRTI